MRIAAYFALGLVVAAALWVYLGSRIAVLADLLYRGPQTSQTFATAELEKDNIVLGERRWPLPGVGAIHLDQLARVVLSRNGESFTLGRVEQRWADSARFTPEKTDQISFARDAGWFAWPTPTYGLFTLGAAAPRWARYAYDRMLWQKADGAILEITWRVVQRKYPTGWFEEYNNQLITFTIHASPLDEIAHEYLRRTKKWARSDYRLEPREPSLVAAIYLKDEAAEHPGAGKSVLLQIDRETKKVVKESAWQ